MTIRKALPPDLILLFSVLFLVACGEEQFALYMPSVNTTVHSSDSEWQKGDKISVIAKTASSAYENHCFVTMEGDGKFIPAEDEDRIQFHVDESCTLFAYYPYLPLSKDMVFEVSSWSLIQTDKMRNWDLRRSDMVTYQAGKEVPELRFRHVFSHISFTIDLAENSGLLPKDTIGLEASLDGMNYPCRYYLMEERFDYEKQLNAEAIPLLHGNDGKYSALIPAETTGGHHPSDRSLVVKLANGKTAVQTFDSSVVFESGRSYHWVIKLKNDGSPIIDHEEGADNSEILAPQRCRISSWQ